MSDDKKVKKVGPKELQMRALREQKFEDDAAKRKAANKALAEAERATKPKSTPKKVAV